MYAPGSILAGKYRIENVLGEGGMGMVVEATHIGLGTRVALKFLHPHLLGHQALMERFMREARASAQLRSEHVCRVSDVGQFDDGTAYIVMELLHGSDLARMLRARGALPSHLAVDYVLQACLGIAEAHQVRIVHRDLKPANLFVTQRPDGTALVKVLDFGVAKAPQEGNFSLTQTANVMGSPGYMSPEQLRSSKEADARSDIWSIGATLYELCSGRQPWAAESITELTLRIAMDPLPPLPPTVHQGLAAAIGKCMEKDPGARFQTVAALAAAIAPFGSPGAAEIANGVARVLRGSAPVMGHSMVPADVHAQTVATPMPGSLPPVPTTLGGSSGMMAGTTPGKKKSWLLPALIGGVVAVGGIVAIVVATSGGGSEAASPAASSPAPSPSPSPAPAPSPSPAPAPAPAPSPESAAAAAAATAPATGSAAAAATAAATAPATAAGSAAGSASTKKKPGTHKQQLKQDINDERL